MDEETVDETEPVEEVDTAEKEKRFPEEVVRRVRRESARYRIQGKAAKQQIEELTTKLNQLESEPNPDIILGREEVTALGEKLAHADLDLTVMHAKNAVALEAYEMGFISPEEAFDLLGDFTSTKAGIQKALKKLLKEHPELTTPKPPPPVPGIGGPPVGSHRFRRLTSADLWLNLLKGGRR